MKNPALKSITLILAGKTETISRPFQANLGCSRGEGMGEMRKTLLVLINKLGSRKIYLLVSFSKAANYFMFKTHNWVSHSGSLHLVEASNITVTCLASTPV